MCPSEEGDTLAGAEKRPSGDLYDCSTCCLFACEQSGDHLFLLVGWLVGGGLLDATSALRLVMFFFELLRGHKRPRLKKHVTFLFGVMHLAP